MFLCRMTEASRGQPESGIPPWARFDTLAICALLAVSLGAHFWRLGTPNVLIYDEHVYVDEAYKYLRGEAFFEIHPPLAILLIAASARLFGCHPWAWRIPSALIGSALAPITYLLARRMFSSRGAATLAAVLLLCEGMFLQYSRLALINIAYVTFGAAAYLALFRFIQSRELIDRRRSLVWMGVALGLALGSKFAIPAITWLLVVGFLLSSLMLVPFSNGPSHESPDQSPGYRDLRYIVGAIALVGSVSGIFFYLVFLPSYTIGWWTGISSLTSYYRHVLLANSFYPDPLSHQDSKWWSWPLMLHPYKLWQQPDDYGMLMVEWGGGNPALWWAALVAIILGGIRALRSSRLSWKFLSIGYLVYLAMWIPVHRAVYLYSYMPALYLAILALAGLLDDCWKGAAKVWEQAVLLLPVFAAGLLGLGYLYGGIVSALVLAGYLLLVRRGLRSGRLVCAMVVATSLAVFLFFLPFWIPLALQDTGVEARMWLDNVGLGSWQ
jgi:dolichyl-phosphate-mannose-protein mannosyltransferase